MERLALREASSLLESFSGNICLISTEAGSSRSRETVSKLDFCGKHLKSRLRPPLFSPSLPPQRWAEPISTANVILMSPLNHSHRVEFQRHPDGSSGAGEKKQKNKKQRGIQREEQINFNTLETACGFKSRAADGLRGNWPTLCTLCNRASICGVPARGS